MLNLKDCHLIVPNVQQINTNYKGSDPTRISINKNYKQSRRAITFNANIFVKNQP